MSMLSEITLTKFAKTGAFPQKFKFKKTTLSINNSKSTGNKRKKIQVNFLKTNKLLLNNLKN